MHKRRRCLRYSTNYTVNSKHETRGHDPPPHTPHSHLSHATHSPHTTVHTQPQSSEKSTAVSELAKAGEFNGPNPELGYAPLPKVNPKWRVD